MSRPISWAFFDERLFTEGLAAPLLQRRVAARTNWLAILSHFCTSAANVLENEQLYISPMTNGCTSFGRRFIRTVELSAKIIDADTSIPSLSAYRRRFGSMANIYRLIGYIPSGRSGRSPRELKMRWTNYGLPETLKQLLKEHGRLSRDIIDADRGTPGCQTYVRRFGSMTRAYRLIGYKPPWLSGRRAGKSDFT